MIRGLAEKTFITFDITFFTGGIKMQQENNEIKTNVEQNEFNNIHIKIDSVSKVFNQHAGNAVTALKDISLEIKEGEFIVILGPSGCGKSTLLRIISGLIKPTNGSVYIKGKKVEGPISDIGFIFQNPTLFKWRKVIENVLFPIDLMGKNVSEYKEKAQQLLDLTNLNGFENNYPKELSGGMQQRVSLCRALISSPHLLLMDEPFGALDALTRDTMNLELLRIWRSSKEKTVIFVTHSITEALFLADRVIILSCRPAVIQEVISENFPRPRTMGLKSLKEFNDITQKIYKIMLGNKI